MKYKSISCQHCILLFGLNTHKRPLRWYEYSKHKEYGLHMLNILKIILILSFCTVFLHCNIENRKIKQKNNSNFIDKITYKNIVRDIFCIEAAIYKDQTEGRNYTESIKKYYSWLFNKYGVNRESIIKSTEFYVSNGIMDSIIQEVIEELRYFQISLDTIKINEVKYQKNIKKIFPFTLPDIPE